MAFAAAAIAGCGKTYEGEAFRIDPLEKFAGVEVYIVNNPKFPSLLKSASDTHKTQISQSIELLSKIDWKTAEKRCELMPAMLGSPQLSSEQKFKNYDAFMLYASQALVLKMEAMESQIKKLLPKEFYRSKIVAEGGVEFVAKTLTNSNGGFKVDARDGTHLLAFSPLDQDFWIIDLSNRTKEIQLTEKNMANKECNGCVVLIDPRISQLARLLYLWKEYDGGRSPRNFCRLTQGAREVEALNEKFLKSN